MHLRHRTLRRFRPPFLAGSAGLPSGTTQIGTIPGWSRLAAASASASKRLVSLSSAELADGDHLERDTAVDANLSCLEDDDHATACDLADDVVIAEVADLLALRRA